MDIETVKANVKGWGSDLAAKDRPGYPMWKRPAEGTGAHWSTPPAQALRFREFHSIERSRMTSVFGTAMPPRGLSGPVRRFAYRYGEGPWAHWPPLVLADRINVLEGVVDDLLHGHVPNVYKEMGGPTERRHNPAGFRRKVIFVSLFAVAVPVIMALAAKSAADRDRSVT